MMREYQENLVTPINMTCYLCNESLGSSLCNYCKAQFPFHDLDDNAFKIVLYEFQHGTISNDTDQLEKLFFNPILDQHSSLSDRNSDLDPDLNNQNYASSASYCNYERGPIRGFRDTGYSRKKLPGYGIFEEKVIGIQDIEK